MKLFGSLSEFLTLVARRSSPSNTITIQPGASTASAGNVTVELPPATTGTSVLADTATAQTFTGKTIDGDDNTVQDLPLTSIKTVLGEANRLLVRNTSGVVTTDAELTFQTSIDTLNIGSLELKGLDSDVRLKSNNGDNSIATDVTFRFEATPEFRGNVGASFYNAANTRFANLVAPSLTADRTIELPDASDTLVGLSTTDILSNKTIVSPTVRGTLLLRNVSGSQPVLALSEDPDNGTDAVSLQAPSSLAASYTLTLPVDDGNSGEVLSTDGSGVLSWTSVLTNPMDSAGDLIVGGVGGVATKLDAGTSTQVLHGGTSPSWAAVSLTADVSGVLPLANGGTNKALTASAGALAYSDADSFEFNTPGTSGDWALSGGTGAPTFSSTTTTAKTIAGSANAIQFTVRGNATQSASILLVEKSDGTDLLTVENDGTLFITPTGTSIIAYGATDSRIISNTADGADSKALSLCGGGASSNTRGGYIQVFGNEHGSSPGKVLINAGGTATGTTVEIDGPTASAILVNASNAVAIRGTNTNDSAASGFVGEYTSSSAAFTNFAATGVYSDLVSISLDAGDWDVTVNTLSRLNGATMAGGSVDVFIGTAAGNNSTGRTDGVNTNEGGPPTTAYQVGMPIPAYRVSLSGTATYYLKTRAFYTAGTPQVAGIISARRVR